MDLFDIIGKTCVHHIDANTDNNTLDHTGLKAADRLSENAADLFTLHKHVVDPFDLRFFTGQLFNCTAYSNGSRGCD